jgi:NAD+ synthase
MQNAYTQIIEGIQNYFAGSGLKNAVLGISGGIDSSLVLKLAVDALGSENVTAISMPENGISRPENTIHAKKLAEALGVKFYSLPINQFLITFNVTPWGSNKIAAQNLKVRTRMALLYHYANTKRALVLGTSNKSEILLGYGTKHGDIACDLNVLGDLFKEDVISLATFVGLPKEIITKAPSAELYTDQTDQAELGGSYSELDPILKRLDEGIEPLIERGMRAALVHDVFGRVKKNKHKSQPVPIIKITHNQ